MAIRSKSGNIEKTWGAFLLPHRRKYLASILPPPFPRIHEIFYMRISLPRINRHIYCLLLVNLLNLWSWRNAMLILTPTTPLPSFSIQRNTARSILAKIRFLRRRNKKENKREKKLKLKLVRWFDRYDRELGIGWLKFEIHQSAPFTGSRGHGSKSSTFLSTDESSHGNGSVPERTTATGLSIEDAGEIQFR